MDSIIEEWLGTYESRDTKTSYKYDIAKFQRWLNRANIVFRQLKLADVRSWQSTLGSTPGDRRLASSVKSLLKYAHNNEYLPNVDRCLQIPKRSAVLVERKLSRQQVDRMLVLAKGNDKLLLKLLFYLGLRISEARRLKRSDIKSINGELVFGVTRKGNKFQNVSLSRGLSQVIVHELPTRGYLFKGKKNGCLSRSQSYRRVKKIAKQVVPKASCHWFRHAFCTLSLQANASLIDVSKAMNHSSIAVTSQYVHESGRSVSRFLE